MRLFSSIFHDDYKPIQSNEKKFHENFHLRANPHVETQESINANNAIRDSSVSIQAVIYFVNARMVCAHLHADDLVSETK